MFNEKAVLMQPVFKHLHCVSLMFLAKLVSESIVNNNY